MERYKSRREYKNKQPSYIVKILLIFIILLLTIFYIRTIAVEGQIGQPDKKYFQVYARQWAYEPSVIEVDQGDIVIINLFSKDVSHGMFIEGYNIGVNLILGEGSPSNVTLKFVADKPGTYTFRCTVTCGPYHPFMTGKLVVKPNNPLYGSIGIAIILAIVAILIFYIWRW